MDHGLVAGVGVGAVIVAALEDIPIGIAIGIADGAAFHRREASLAEETFLAVSLQVAGAREPLRGQRIFTMAGGEWPA